MGLSHSPSIVTNGLVLALDAGNTKSYPGTGTTWTDLSSAGKTGTLTNGPTFSSDNGGTLVFDGTDDYVPCTGTNTVTEATFIAWIKRNGTQLSWAGILHSRVTTDATPNSGLNFYSNTNNLGYHWSASPNNPPGWNSGVTIPDAAWCMCAVSVSPTVGNLYLGSSSGITTAQNVATHNSLDINAVKVGVDFGFSRQFKGNIAVAKIYSRALTAVEIQQNFNALRGRFGV